MTTRSSRCTRAAIAAVAVLALAAHVATGSALGGLRASVDNSGNTAATGTLLYTHSYGSSCTSVPSGSITDAIQSVSCPGSLYPSSSVGTHDDAITAKGTVPASAVTETAAIASCGVVQLANRMSTARPLLARYGTSFATTGGPMNGTAGFVAVDGATPGGYETSAVQQAQPNPGLSLGTTYGLGIWFKTSSTSGGPLFGFGDSPANVAGTNDRVLFMTSAGKIGFTLNTAGNTTGLSGGSFNNGAWHFAYVTMSVTSIIGVGLISAVTVYVDGGQVTTGGGALVGLSSYSGYWHLGWSPAANGNPAPYFAGSLSNFVVFNGGNAPSNSTLGVPASQTAFDTATSTATEHWRLNDSGTSTLAAGFNLPVIGTTAPCSYVDIKWGFTNPTSCAVAPRSTTTVCTIATTTLSAAAGVTPVYTIATVAAGTTQTGTIALAKDSTYTATVGGFAPGLIVYAPVTMTFKVTKATNWYSTFTWSSAGSGFVL